MTDTKTSDDGFAGQKSPTAGASDFNAQAFLIYQMLGKVRTIGIAQVKAVHNADVLGTPPTVDVQPMIKMLDGNNQATEHGTIYGLPYIRLQGGLNGVLTPPAVDDFVVTLTADRDISSFIKAPGIVNPGSLRRHDLADGIALGGICNAVPTQYLRFKLDDDGNPAGFDVVDALGNSIKTDANGMVMTDKFGHIINMKSSGIEITGDVKITGKLDVTAEITAKAGSGGSVTVTGHQHGTGTPKPAGTNAPTGGT